MSVGYRFSEPVTLPDPDPFIGTLTAADAASVTVVGAGTQSIVTGTPTVGSVALATFFGVASVLVQVSGTFVGSLQFEQTADGGATWCAVLLNILGSTSSATKTTTTIGAFSGAVAGATGFRVRATAWTSGTAKVVIQPGVGSSGGSSGGGGGGGGGGAVTVADGADVTLGTTTDAAKTTDVAGTAVGFLRGLVKILASAWDSVNGLFHGNVKQVGGTAFALGQQVAASSLPIVMTAAQVTALTPLASVPSTLVDGANVALGATADAIVAAGAAGTLSAKLRRVTQGLEDLKSLIVLAPGSTVIANAPLQASPIVLFDATVNQAGVSQSALLFPTTVALSAALPAIGSGNAVTITSGGNVCGAIFSPRTSWDSVLLDLLGVGVASTQTLTIEIGRLAAAGAVPQVLASVVLTASTITLGPTTINPLTGASGHASATWRFFDAVTITAKSQLGAVLQAIGGTSGGGPQQLLVGVNAEAYYYVLVTALNASFTEFMATITPTN